MALQDDLRMKWRTGGMVVRLILVNIAVFLGLWLTYAVLLLPFGGRTAALGAIGEHVLPWVAMPASLKALLWKPWTVVTAIFGHVEPMHLFWNMVLLWFGGRMFQDLLGDKRLLGTYLLSGFVGSLLWIIGVHAYGRLGSATTLLGASGAVIGVLVCIATYRPHMLVNLIFIGPVKIMYVAAAFVFLDLIGVGSDGQVAHEAHIGGALYGFLAAQQLKRGNDWSLTFVQFLEKLSPFRKRRSSRLRVEKSFVRNSRSDVDYNASKRDKQARVDSILDKISRSGYDSLSKEEKDFLFKASDGK